MPSSKKLLTPCWVLSKRRVGSADFSVAADMTPETRDIIKAAKIIGVDPDTLEYEEARKVLQRYMIESANVRIRKAKRDTSDPKS